MTLTNQPSTPAPVAQAMPAVPGELPLRTSQNIQGNVLAAFNKDHQTVLLLRLPSDRTAARAWLAEVEPLVASTREVADFNAAFSAQRRTLGHDPEHLNAVWTALGLTHSGLARLVNDPAALDAQLAQLAQHRRPPVFGSQLSFVSGPVSNAARLGDAGDSAPERWLFGGPGTAAVDAIVTVAADRPHDLDRRVRHIEDIGTRHGVQTVYVQPGATLPGAGAGHEHFGFKDGVSQPGVRGFDPPDPHNPGDVLGRPGTRLIAAGEFVLGYPDENDQTTPVPDWMVDGSFQVLRLLGQDVPGWWEQVHRAVPNATDAEQERLAARLVGRWRSGAPVENFPDADPKTAAASSDNDFGYQRHDAAGAAVPHCAHIRKLYPRDAEPPNPSTGGENASQTRRIMRRGIPFGAPFDPSGGPGEGVDDDRGLVFTAYVASIEAQFEFLQQLWANNADFPVKSDGPDPVIGATTADSQVRLPNPDGSPTTFGISRFVRTMGATYGFAPSRATLRGLAAGGI